MTYLKKIIFAATLAVASLGFSLSANAVLVTHDLLLDDTIVGELTVSLLENGAQSNGIEFIDEFVSFTFGGVAVTDNLGFFATIDGDNIFAGIDFLLFEVDVVDKGFSGIYDVLYVGILDPLDFLASTLTVFELPSINTIDFGILSLSTARVVSEPSLLALFALALVGFGVRRKAK